MSDADFTVVFLPDTQKYSESYAATFSGQMQWCVDNKETFNIQAVVHLGDIVDDDVSGQWNNADAAFLVLDNDGTIPYIPTIGNHDYDDTDGAGSAKSRDTTQYNTYFGPSRYTGYDWWSGDRFEDGKSENIYLLRDIGSQGYIFFGLEFGPRSGVMAWVGDTLSTYSDRLAIISTHAFLTRGGTLYTTGDTYNPHDYTLDGDINDGTEMWEDYLSGFDNIAIIHGGHDIDGANAINSRAILKGNDGYITRSYIVNYQGITNGGNGYFRIMKVRPSRNLLEFSTYSSSLSSYVYGIGKQYSSCYRRQY